MPRPNPASAQRIESSSQSDAVGHLGPYRLLVCEVPDLAIDKSENIALAYARNPLVRQDLLHRSRDVVSGLETRPDEQPAVLARSIPRRIETPSIVTHSPVFTPRPETHYRFPRFSCSSSKASNSALKLPLPKLWLPRRQMISKNSVGRSCSGLVNSCSR